jgi:hypothetical protein
VVISEISEGQVSMGYGGGGVFRLVLQKNVAFPAYGPPGWALRYLTYYEGLG